MTDKRDNTYETALPYMDKMRSDILKISNLLKLIEDTMEPMSVVLSTREPEDVKAKSILSVTKMVLRKKLNDSHSALSPAFLDLQNIGIKMENNLPMGSRYQNFSNELSDLRECRTHLINHWGNIKESVEAIVYSKG